MNVITNPAELRRKGLEVLVRELGYVNAMRYMLQSETGYGDYACDRDAALPDGSVEELARQADQFVHKR